MQLPFFTATAPRAVFRRELAAHLYRLDDPLRPIET